MSAGSSLMERSVAAGRWLVFHTSQALLPEDTNNAYDVYLQDLQDSSLTWISAGGNRSSFYASISADGNCIAYASDATNLVAGDTNGRRDIFLHDRAAGTTVRVSNAQGGAQSTGTANFPVISADGCMIAFVSNGALLEAKTSHALDVFLHDAQTGTTTLLTPGLTGTGSNAACSALSMSGDARFVAFVSAASNLVAHDTNGAPDIFLLDRSTGVTERVSVGPGGVQSAGPSSQPSVSDDGRYVAFDSAAKNLVEGDTNSRRDVFVRDRLEGTTTRFSVASDGSQGNGDSFQPTLSRTGHYLAFSSKASNLVSGDANGVGDVFWLLMDAPTLIKMASKTSGGAPGDGESTQAAWDPASPRLTFRTGASNLVPGATSTLPRVPLLATLLEPFKLMASDFETTSVSGQLGYSVSLDGKTALMGAPRADGDRGRAYVFVRSEEGWSQEAILVAPNAAVGDWFGESVSLDGETAVVGSRDVTGKCGAACVFVRSNGVWVLQTVLHGWDAVEGDLFGSAVCVAGDLVLVGAPQGNGSTGCVYEFRFNPGELTWENGQKLVASDGEANDTFGCSLAIISTNVLCIGAKGDDSSRGSVYRFGRSLEGTLSQYQKLVAPEPEAGDAFGCSVSGFARPPYYALLVGARGEDSQRGAAYVFRPVRGGYQMDHKLVPSVGGSNIHFGYSVSMGKDQALVGAYGLQMGTGGAFVYTCSEGSWTEQSVLHAPDGASFDVFGRSVSLDGGTALVGASQDDTWLSDHGSAWAFPLP